MRWLAAIAVAALLSHWLGSGAGEIVERPACLDCPATTSFGAP